VLITTDDGSIVDFVHVWVAPVTRITLARRDGDRIAGALGLAVGEDVTLAPTLWNHAQRLSGDADVTWTVSDQSVISVLRDGSIGRRLRARGPGKATVTVAPATAGPRSTWSSEPPCPRPRRPPAAGLRVRAHASANRAARAPPLSTRSTAWALVLPMELSQGVAMAVTCRRDGPCERLWSPDDPDIAEVRRLARRPRTQRPGQPATAAAAVVVGKAPAAPACTCAGRPPRDRGHHRATAVNSRGRRSGRVAAAVVDRSITSTQTTE
jgi:hypothetical protein